MSADDAASAAEKTHLAHISKLFHDPQYSDLTIECQGRRWSAHKSIISSRCTFFAKACDGRFKVLNSWPELDERGTDMTKEGLEGEISLPADDPHAVHAMLSFIYQCDYDDAGPDMECDAGMPPILLNVGVAVIAHKYDLPELSSLALRKFTNRAQTEWRSQKFARAVRDIYNMEQGIDTAFRQCVLKVCAANAQDIFSGSSDGGEDGNLLDMMRNIPDLGVDLAQDLLHRRNRISIVLNPNEKRYKCRNCPYSFIMQDLSSGLTPILLYCPYCGVADRWSIWRDNREMKG